MKKIVLILIFSYSGSFSQQLFYSNVLYGGITGNGVSRGNGAGTSNFSIQIPPNSTIKKAYLIAARDSLADDITVTLNGFNYTFSNATIITNGFNAFKNSFVNRPNSSMHALDITANIDSSVNSYSIIIPPQPNGIEGTYTFFYLYIVFENASLPLISCNLFLNTQDVAFITLYSLANLTPINNNKPVGLAVNTLQFCDTIIDGSYVQVNADTIGLLGGDDLNSNFVTCVGAWANFAHYNDSLFGLDDDTPDSLMGATDALADIKNYVNNGDTSVNITFTYQSNLEPLSNPIRAVMLSYSTPCDTFTTTITTNDTLCLGSSVQIQATGGINYSWFATFGGLNDTTIANPIATPTQTTTYIVTITNDSGCVKTEQVKIWVNPLPKPDTLVVSNNFCGDSVGNITVGAISNGGQPFMYSLTNLTTLNSTTQSNNLFNQLSTINYQLSTGNYQLIITDANGCQFTDTIALTETNNVQANFTVNPNSGSAPLNVDFTNTSTAANNYSWAITSSNNDTLNWIPACAGNAATCGMSYTFNSSGTYQVCLIAYNNIPTCADTICQTIIVDDEIGLFIPNLFTPNGDGANDAFVISITGINLIENLKAEVFNRWGMLVASKQFLVDGFTQTLNTNNQQLTIWDGRTTAGAELPESTYYYVVTYTKKTGETIVEKRSLTLLR